MAMPVIIEKLRKILSRPIMEESQVVYILVEIRKFLELSEYTVNNEYQALNFYCSWVVHTTMDRGTARKILQVFDKAQPSIVSGLPLQDTPNYVELLEITGLDQFRENLRKFINSQNLPEIIVETGWTEFLRLFANIITDCPLKVKSGNGDLNNITQVNVSLKKSAEVPKTQGDQYQSYQILWTIQDKNGESSTPFIICLL